MERRNFTLREVKFFDDSQKTGLITGYASTFGGPPDAYGDVIEAGAFSKDLAEWKKKGKWPKMLLQHGGGMFGGADDLVPIGKWTNMAEDGKGLKVEGRLFGMDTDRGQRIFEAIKEGELDGLSIGFRVRKFRHGTRAGEPDRTLEEIELVEVSLVTFPANERATVTSVKNEIICVRSFEAALRNRLGFSVRDARKLASGGWAAYARSKDELYDPEELAELESSVSGLAEMIRKSTEKFKGITDGTKANSGVRTRP